MSMIFRRQLSTLIPPKVASPATLHGAPNAKRMADVVSFYKALPQGAAPALPKTANPFKLYYRKYFHPKNGKASGAPLLHLILGIFLFGYISDYQFHLKHHKNGAH
ncbi:ATP synthase subunit f [Yarrowia sp. B02]|nr:ATP synthase subunit f [Yarrowia sp. B02]